MYHIRYIEIVAMDKIRNWNNFKLRSYKIYETVALNGTINENALLLTKN